MIIAGVNGCVLLLVGLFIAYADYKEDKDYYENFEYVNRGKKWNT